MREQYDVIFIGGGHATIHAASILNQAKKSVLIIEKNTMGGTCTTYGCDPKILLDAPFEIVYQAERYKGIGLDTDIKVNWKDLMKYKNKIINPLNIMAEKMFSERGIDIIKGKAYFVDNHTLKVNDKEYKAENIVIGTGQRPAKLNIIGTEYSHDSTDMLFLEKLPSSITFIGAGIISLEFVSMLVKVNQNIEINIIEYSDRALTQYYKEYTNKLVEELKKLGINFYFKEEVTGIVKENEEKYIVKTKSGLEMKTAYVVDATGRVSNIEGFGLEEIGVKCDRGGIIVDEYLRTSIPNIFASGDVISKRIPKLTPTAAHESKYIASYILGNYNPIVYPVIPSLVFTIPRIAQVGETQEDIIKEKNHKVMNFKYGEMMLFQQKNEIEAELRVVLDKDNYLVGADIYGEEAADLINVLTLIINQKLRKNDLEKMIFAFPSTTYGVLNFFLTNILVD